MKVDHHRSATSQHTDVLVVGGGMAGVAAACAAAESGAQVVIAERYGFFGGMATAARVGTICGLYLRSTERLRSVHGGFVRHFAELIAHRSASTPQHYTSGLWYLPYDEGVVRILCDELLQQRGVKIAFHSWVTQPVVSGARITEVRLNGLRSTTSIFPHTVVDCTGEAVVCQQVAHPMIEETTYQAGAVVFDLAPVSNGEPKLLQQEIVHAVLHGIAEGVLDPSLRGISVVHGSHRQGKVSLKLSLPSAQGSGDESITATEIAARLRISELHAFLQARLTSCKESAVITFSSQIGLRTGARPVGRETLSEDDLHSARRYSDAVARGAWPGEHWGSAPQPEMTYFAEESFYDIRAGCLSSPVVENLLFAGRCLSASELGISSARVIGTCLATGYAAGTLAAFSATGKTQCEAIDVIQRSLFEDVAT